jgi:hypothetical protein
MSRFIGLSLKHIELDAQGEPVAFTWRGVTYRGKVILTWNLRDRWWEREAYSHRTYFRLMTADYQVFDLYRKNTSRGLWVFSHIHD